MGLYFRGMACVNKGLTAEHARDSVLVNAASAAAKRATRLANQLGTELILAEARRRIMPGRIALLGIAPQFSSYAGNWALTSAARWCSRSLSCL